MKQSSDNLPFLLSQYKTVAVALNPTDTAALSNPCTLTETPLVVGCDSSGTVLAVGSNVEHIKVGDRVASIVFGTYDEYNGAFAEAVKSNRKTTWVLSEEMRGEEGAAFTVRRAFSLSLPSSDHLELIKLM